MAAVDDSMTMATNPTTTATRNTHLNIEPPARPSRHDLTPTLDDNELEPDRV
jgi:hypothetical protein